MSIFTRTEYLNVAPEERAAAHLRYYAQFVTPYVIAYVERTIGRAKILASTDKHLNDIPLDRWDGLEFMIRNTCSDMMLLAAGSRSMSQSDCVCIAKEAARQIQEAAGPRGWSCV